MDIVREPFFVTFATVALFYAGHFLTFLALWAIASLPGAILMMDGMERQNNWQTGLGLVASLIAPLAAFTFYL